MKKRFFYLGGATFVAVVAFMFTSCSQDDDFIINNGLDIDSQVPMTRSESGDGFDINHGYDKVDYKDGDCGLKTIMEWLKKKITFTEYNTAQDYCDRLRAKAVQMDKANNPDDPQRYNGEGYMPTDIFVSLAQSNGVLNGDASNTREYVDAKAIQTEEWDQAKNKWVYHVGKVEYVYTKKDEEGKKVATKFRYQGPSDIKTISVDDEHFKRAWK